MRRKCFTIMLFLFILTYFLISLGVSFNRSEIKMLELGEKSHSYVCHITKYKETNEKVSLYCKIKEVDGKKVKYSGNVLLNIYEFDDDLTKYIYSDISFSAKLKVPDTERNPHCFNYKNYLRSKNTYLYSSVYGYKLDSSNLTKLEKVKKILFEKKIEFSNDITGDYKGIILGVLFGDTSMIDDETYSSFENNGTSHILAISGLHISIIYSLIEKLLERKKKYIKYLIIFFVFYSYGTICMWSVSITRAIIMITLKIICYEFDLRYDRLTSISIAAFLIYLFNPYAILGTSFQLSFLAVLSIAIFSNIIKDKVPKVLNQSISVTIGILFYECYVFNYFSIFSILINVPIIFLAGYLVPMSLILFIMYLIVGKVGLLNNILDTLAMVLVKVNNITSILGLKGMDVTGKYASIIMVITILVFYISSEHLYILKKRKNRKKIIKEAISIIFILSLFFSINFSPITYDDIVFIDVGQGDCIHFRDGKIDILIDGGGNGYSNVGEKTLKPYLLKNGVKNLDLVLLTHLHTDHYQGIVELNEVYQLKNIKTDNVKGNTFKISDSFYIETLWPLKKEDSKDLNENCSVYMVHYHGIKILITGDLDQTGEKKMCEVYKNGELKCDILKVGHHGSDTSTSDEFLKATNPKYFVIQVGKNNIYGHPSNETIYKLEKVNGIILRTDLDGAIGFRLTSDGIIYHKQME